MSWFNPPPVPLARKAVLTAVFRYHPDQPAPSGRWEPMPNVRFLGLRAREGPEPWEARVRYAPGDPLADPDDPKRLEDFFPYTAYAPRVFKQDDRLVALAVFPDGSHEMIFSGFFQAPQGDLGADTEFVTATVLSDIVREADYPLAGSVRRDADDPTNRKKDVQTGSLPPVFNPGNRPNASPLDTSNPQNPDGVGDSGGYPNTYPVFCGPFPPDDTINTFDLRLWTLPMAARYLCVIGARTTDGKGNYRPSAYVRFPSLAFLDSVLTAVAPSDDNDTGFIDPTDDSTYTLEDIDCPDTDCQGMPWAHALWRLIEPYGFGMNFVLHEDTPAGPDWPGNPYWTLDVYRKDYSMRRKSLLRQKAGEALDPGLTNAQSLSLARDSSGMANRVEVDADPVTVEAGFVLAPGFPIAAADVTNKAQYVLGDHSAVTSTPKTDDYRLWVFDECAEGHWDWGANGGAGGVVQTPGLFEPALLLGKKTRTWVNRRRPAETNLATTDPAGDPLRPTLWVSFDYQGPQPGVWDGTGTWQQIVSGEWESLDDRLGVFIGARDPDVWNVGKVEGGLSQVAGGKMALVTWHDPKDSTRPYPRFMLVCCVEADDDFNAVAPKRASSPSAFTTVRRVDASGRFRRTVVSRWSKYADPKNFKVKDVFKRDDKAEAQALADMTRRASECGTFAGPAVVRRFTDAYGVGDQIVSVDGRDISLRTNGGAGAGEAPVYPVVVGVDYDFDGEQATTLTLSDHRAQPPPRKGRRRSRR